MAKIYAGGAIKKIYADGMIRKVYAHYGLGEIALVFSSSISVTYVVNTGVSYTEEVEYGASCLSPSSFVPSKDGYKFIGWAETIGGSVLKSKTAGTEPITLYAVFIPNTITINYYNRDTYPYVATAGNYADSDGWRGDVGYAGNILYIQDVGKGYINKLIDCTYYNRITINMQGTYYNHKGTLTFGIGNDNASDSFAKSTNVSFPDASVGSASGSLSISDVIGNFYLKFVNHDYKGCGITSIVLSV